MSDIHFDCPQCRQPIDAPQAMADQTVNCPACQDAIKVPGGRDESQCAPPIKRGIDFSNPVHRMGVFLFVAFFGSVLYYFCFNAVIHSRTAAAAQESERLKAIQQSSLEARKAFQELDAAIHGTK